MIEFIKKLVDASGFMPRRYCGSWTTAEILLHNISDAIIWLAYMAIPVVLIYFVRKKRGKVPFPKMFWMFGAFIILCGTTHFMEIVMFYKPLYHLSGLLKALTAAVSLITAIALVPLVPKALAMRTSEELEHEINERKLALGRLEEAHRQLVHASRLAGMSEVATAVLHNVGNVLNSVNVSATLVTDTIRESKLSGFKKAVALMSEQADLGQFFSTDPKGLQLPGYLSKLAEHLSSERTLVMNELNSLSKNVDHIKEIVSMQQAYARVSAVVEPVSLAELVDDALRMNAGALARHNVQVVREYDEMPKGLLEKHKALQILVNLISNAKYAMDDGKPAVKQLTIRLKRNGHNHMKIAVTDNGIGISTENLTQIFAYGFTTKKSGHGFGLHSGALAAREMGGALQVHSDGPGKGATFTLELPLELEEGNA